MGSLGRKLQRSLKLLRMKVIFTLLLTLSGANTTAGMERAQQSLSIPCRCDIVTCFSWARQRRKMVGMLALQAMRASAAVPLLLQVPAQRQLLRFIVLSR